jgi:hypothetical protein
LLSALLIFWGTGVAAPLEAPATLAETPNPSKAPWYFVGLQEMLLYFDAWYAGVTVPLLILFGLAAIPYLDFNKAGSGCYSIRQRTFAYLTFQFGFLGLWIGLIVMATFLRGPNWIAFGPYEPWDVHRTLVQENVDLSTWFWATCLGRDVPVAAAGVGVMQQLGVILLRESLGLVLLGAYLIGLPVVLARTVMRTFYAEMGRMRFVILSGLLLLMVLLPIKMLLNWCFHLRFIVSIPEFLLNF